MDHDILYVGEFRFPVLKDKATLHALVSNATDFRLYWMINVPCEGADVELDGETHHVWQPKVYHESMTFSCRNWTDEPVSDETLQEILELARFAPNGGNRQGWHVIVIR